MRKLLLGLVFGVGTIALAAQPASAFSGSSVRSPLGAGYRSANNSSISTATTRVTVPEITCAHNDDYEPLVLGVFGLDSANTQTSWAAVYAACNNGSKTYYAGAYTAG